MRYLTKDEMQKVLVHAIHGSRRDYLMIMLGVNHGLRASEVISLKLADVADGVITVARLKGSNKTTHPLSTKESEALADWLMERPDEGDRLFPMTRRQFGRIVKGHMLAVGVPKELAHPHSLKHSTCSQMSKAGIGIEFIRVYVGHADIKSTAVYLDISDEEASAKAQAVFN